MLRNYLAAALRNLARNRLHSAITTLSLAIGFAGLILAAIFARYETTYDRFWPDWERIYLATHLTHVPNRGTFTRDTAPGNLAAAIKGEINGIEDVTRMARERMRVSRGQVEIDERSLFWIDANFFTVLQPKVLTGDLSALPPGAVVLPRSVAEKYFGRGTAVGQTLTLERGAPGATPPPPRGRLGDQKAPIAPKAGDGQPAEIILAPVAAVIEDLPPNSHMPAELFVVARDPARLSAPGTYALTYFKVRPGVSEQAVHQAFATLSKQHLPSTAKAPMGLQGRPELKAVPLRHAYMKPLGQMATWSMSELATGQPLGYLLLWSLSALLLGVAAINFVTLMTARGAGRAVEVGVRKAAGARRADLVLQFVGEALLHAFLALALALALVELALPMARKAFALPLRLDYLGDPAFFLAMVAGAAAIGLVAGFYPALALSAFRPAKVLKGGLAKTPGSAAVRQVLLAIQFTPLLVLALGAFSVDGQLRRAEQNSQKVMPPHTLMVRTRCTPALKAAIATVPEVRETACLEMDSTTTTLRASLESIGLTSKAGVKAPSQPDRQVERALIADREGLEFWGLKPLAGRLWIQTDDSGLVINATLARSLGFADPAGAVDRILDFRRDEGAPFSPRRIIGVVPDRGGLAGIETLAFFQDSNAERRARLGVRLTGRDVEETVAAIDRALLAQGVAAPIDRQFYRDIVAESFLGLRQATQLAGAFIAVCVVIAVFGLFGLAAFLAGQRTKEMGVRKALGASRGRLIQRLLFQFARPVLIANLVACPLVLVASEILQRGEPPEDRIALGVAQVAPVVFGSLAIAFLATFAHAWQVTGARPVTALRYE